MISELADLSVELSETAVSYATALRGAAKQMRVMRKLTADMRVEAHQEGPKRDMLAIWEEQAHILEQACDLIDRGPLASKQMAAEIVGILENPTSNPLADQLGECSLEVRDYFHERAAQIAEAYVGRVSRESK